MRVVEPENHVAPPCGCCRKRLSPYMRECQRSDGRILSDSCQCDRHRTLSPVTLRERAGEAFRIINQPRPRDHVGDDAKPVSRECAGRTSRTRQESRVARKTVRLIHAGTPQSPTVDTARPICRHHARSTPTLRCSWSFCLQADRGNERYGDWLQPLHTSEIRHPHTLSARSADASFGNNDRGPRWTWNQQ